LNHRIPIALALVLAASGVSEPAARAGAAPQGAGRLTSGPAAPTEAASAAGEGTASAGNAAEVRRLYREGLQALEAEDFDRAEERLKQVLDRDPRHLDALWNLALLYERTGNLTYARSLLLRALEASPEKRPIEERLTVVESRLRAQLLDEIDRLEAEKRWSEAIPVAKRLLVLDPEDHATTYRMGEFHLELGEPEQALSAFDRALELEPRAAYEQARDQARAAVEQSHVQELKEQARLHLVRGEIDEARPLLEEILRLAPGDRWSREALAGKGPGGRVADSTAVGRSEEGNRLSLAPVGRAVRAAGGFLSAAGGKAAAFLREPVLYAALLLAALLYLVVRLPGALMRSGRRGFLTGSLHHIQPRDLFGFLHDLNKSGLVTIQRRKGGARVVFEKGEIVNAETSRNDGVSAVNEVLEWTDGRFYLRKATHVYRRNVDIPLPLLLMDSVDIGEESPEADRESDAPRSRMMELLEKGKD
jgi:tetratricopeptide (TPR) repeat protein